MWWLAALTRPRLEEGVRALMDPGSSPKLMMFVSDAGELLWVWWLPEEEEGRPARDEPRGLPGPLLAPRCC